MREKRERERKVKSDILMPAQMSRRKVRGLSVEDAVEFFNYVMEEKPFLPFLIPLVLFAWGIERWVFSFSNWVPLAVAVWATIQV